MRMRRHDAALKCKPATSADVLVSCRRYGNSVRLKKKKPQHQQKYKTNPAVLRLVMFCLVDVRRGERGEMRASKLLGSRET